MKREVRIPKANTGSSPENAADGFFFEKKGRHTILPDIFEKGTTIGLSAFAVDFELDFEFTPSN